MQTDKLIEIREHINMVKLYENLPIKYQLHEIRVSLSKLSYAKEVAEKDLEKMKLLGDTSVYDLYIPCLNALIHDYLYKLEILKQARKVQLHESLFKLISACLNAVSVGIILGTIFTKVLSL